MLMENTLELLDITDSNIKITRFSAESVNGEKRNVIEARTDIVEEGHTLSHQLKRSVLHMARSGITATGIACSIST